MMRRPLLTLLAILSFCSFCHGAVVTGQRERVVIRVRGMFCNSCADTVKHAVAPLPGILSVAVDMGSNRVTVTYYRQKGSVPRMLEAIRKAGYRADLPPTKPN
jgi:Cu+-exporting ATPase